MNSILGIDPGMSGALSFYNGNELLVYDMPTIEIIKNGGKRKKIDIQMLRKIVASQYADHVYIEQVSAQPGNGASAAFTYGFGCGVIEAVVSCSGLPFTYASPTKWKKAMGCPANKDGARMRASQLLPQFAHNWSRKKDDGRAESSLLALYGFRQLGFDKS